MGSKIEQNTTNDLFVDSKKLLEAALEANLRLSYEDRIEAHENARQLLVDLQQAGNKLRAES